MLDEITGTRKLNKNTIFLELRNHIVEGHYQTGERLPPERELASIFGVARGTLREGLRDLETAGLVERRQGSGTYVSYKPENTLPGIIERARPLELVDTRLALEPHICRKAVLHATDPDFRRVERMLVAMERSVNDPVNFSVIDDEYHLALAELSGNSLMRFMAGNLSMARKHAQWSRVRTITLNPTIIRLYNAQHRQIYNAIRAREPETAALQMKKHILTARESLQNIADV